MPLDHHQLCGWLKAAGWPVPDAAAVRDLEGLNVGDNLLSLLLQGCCRDRSARRLRGWLERSQQQGARLELLASGPEESRWVWWPATPPAGRRVVVISSRLGRQLAQQSGWFAVLRELESELGAQDVLLTAAGTTAHRYLPRCAQLWQRPLLTLVPPRRATTFAAWARRLPHRTSAPGSVGEGASGWVSPPLPRTHLPGVVPRWGGLPDGDRFALQLAQCVYLLRLRPRGRLWPAISDYLTHCGLPAGGWHLALGPELVPTEPAAVLLAQGAQAWSVADGEAAEPAATIVTVPARWPPRLAISPPIRRLLAGDWLIHCTRGATGPWPGQSKAEWLDDLLLGRPSADQSPLEALERIVRELRLRASAQAIRGATPVVCFTAARLDELAALHTFRPHRLRWDFCPYGIAIGREWLAARGARPVLYGEPEAWLSLPPELHPFFQRGVSGTGLKSLDWTREREWRHLGDVPLEELSCTRAVLFVPRPCEAQRLRPLSPWPVVALADSPQ